MYQYSQRVASSAVKGKLQVGMLHLKPSGKKTPETKPKVELIDLREKRYVWHICRTGNTISAVKHAGGSFIL